MVDTNSDTYVRRLEEENQRLKVSLAELTILNDIARAISSAWSLERILELIVRKCVKHFRAEQGAVMLFDPKDEEKPFHTMIRRADVTECALPYRLDSQLMGWMIKYRQPLLANDLQSDPRFNVDREKDQPIRSVLSVPLLFKGRMIGSLNVFNKQGAEGFTDADKRLLTIIGSESAQVIESARLYEEEQALQLMQKEMKLAYQIQVGLLPQTAPEIAGYDIWGKSIPARDVGGDHYDFIHVGEHRLVICLGDVSGKGMPAALLAANLQATLRAQILQGMGPKECLEQSNTHLLRSMNPDRFVTLFYAELDSSTHRLSYSNAGHNRPFLFREAGDVSRLGTGGVALGCMDKVSYKDDHVVLGPGDMLVIYSDGITEAINERQEMFGERRLLQTVEENRAESAKDLVERLIRTVSQHTGELPQTDDMTAVVIKRGKS